MHDVAAVGRSVKKIPVDGLEIHGIVFATRLAVLFMLLFITAGAAHQDSLPQFLDRMRASGGPAWDVHLSSSSVITAVGGTALVTSDTQGVRFATYECVKSLCDGEYFDGERLFSININGTALPQSDLGDMFLRSQRTIASHAFLAPVYADNGGRITDEGVTTIEGAPYRTLLVANTGSVPIQVFVDPGTARIRFFRDVGGAATFEYRDYRRVGSSLELPFLVLKNGSVLERYEAREVRSGAFSQPHGLRPTFQGPATPIATDPTRSIPIFACTIGGVTTTCLLDSGNSGVAISDQLSASLNCVVVGSIQVRGLGKYAAPIVRAGPLVVGNVTFPQANYVVLHHIHRFGYDVVLGADVLASTRVKLESAAHRITFGAEASAYAQSLPLHFLNFVPTVSVRLGDLGTQLAVDTGDESNINLSYGFYTEHREIFSATEQRIVDGIGGSSVELIGNIPEVRIGDISLQNQRIGTTTTLQSTAYGHLGAGFLAQFSVLLDYAASRIEFIKMPSPVPSSP